MPKVYVLLSGCGVMDGSEIYEAVLTLLALDRAGADVQCTAPNISQRLVINHLTGEETGEKRNVLIEAARIARGEIIDLAGVRANDFDALILPGGWGAAKNLCTFALDGLDCKVDPEVARIVGETVHAKKPLGVICIAPALLAKILSGKPKVKITIGNDAGAASKINALGAEHHECAVTEAFVDRENKIVSTPAFMLAKHISEAEKGITALVKNVLQLAAAGAEV